MKKMKPLVDSRSYFIISFLRPPSFSNSVNHSWPPWLSISLVQIFTLSLLAHLHAWCFLFINKYYHQLACAKLQCSSVSIHAHKRCVCALQSIAHCFLLLLFVVCKVGRHHCAGAGISACFCQPV